MRYLPNFMRSPSGALVKICNSTTSIFLSAGGGGAGSGSGGTSAGSSGGSGGGGGGDGNE